MREKSILMLVAVSLCLCLIGCNASSDDSENKGLISRGGDDNTPPADDDDYAPPEDSGSPVGDDDDNDDNNDQTDAGHPPEDSGTPLEDGGQPPTDAGSYDGGNVDAGPIDAGGVTRDELCIRKCFLLRNCLDIYPSETSCKALCRQEYQEPPPQKLIDEVACLESAKNCDEAAICVGKGVDAGDDDDDIDAGPADTGYEDAGEEDTGPTDTGPRDTGGAADAGQPLCNHDPKDCDHKPPCKSDDDCSCAFMCISGQCLSQHCYCAEKRGEDPCGKGMECDENSLTGMCVKATYSCSSDKDCSTLGGNWVCTNGKCSRQSNTCSVGDPNACSDYGTAKYECINGICVGAGIHNDKCPNHTDFDCASGHVCINGTCKQSCENPGNPCPPPASGTCYQQSLMGLPVGPAYCN